MNTIAQSWAWIMIFSYVWICNNVVCLLLYLYSIAFGSNMYMNGIITSFMRRIKALFHCFNYSYLNLMIHLIQNIISWSCNVVYVGLLINLNIPFSFNIWDIFDPMITFWTRYESFRPRNHISDPFPAISNVIWELKEMKTDIWYPRL